MLIAKTFHSADLLADTAPGNKVEAQRPPFYLVTLSMLGGAPNFVCYGKKCQNSRHARR